MIAPDARADDGDARVTAFVGALEELTQRGRDAQHAEVVGADRKRTDAFGLPTIGQVRPFGRYVYRAAMSSVRLLSRSATTTGPGR